MENAFHCNCAPGYNGDLCDTGKFSLNMQSLTDRDKILLYFLCYRKVFFPALELPQSSTSVLQNLNIRFFFSLLKQSQKIQVHLIR